MLIQFSCEDSTTLDLRPSGLHAVPDHTAVELSGLTVLRYAAIFGSSAWRSKFISSLRFARQRVIAMPALSVPSAEFEFHILIADEIFCYRFVLAEPWLVLAEDLKLVDRKTLGAEKLFSRRRDQFDLSTRLKTEISEEACERLTAACRADPLKLLLNALNDHGWRVAHTVRRWFSETLRFDAGAQRDLVTVVDDFSPRCAGEMPRPTSRSQFIFATSDTSLLDHPLLGPDSIWFLEESESGSHELYSLAEFKTGHLAQLTGQIERGFLSGRFGAGEYPPCR